MGVKKTPPNPTRGMGAVRCHLISLRYTLHRPSSYYCWISLCGTLLGAVHCSVLHIALGCTLLSTAHCSRLHIALSCTLLGAAHCSWLHTALGYTSLSAALLLTTHCSRLHIAFGCTMPLNTTKRNITKRIYTYYAILVSVCACVCLAVAMAVSMALGDFIRDPLPTKRLCRLCNIDA